MSDRNRVSRTGDLVFIGDAHLDQDDPDVDAFLVFLERLEPTLDRLVLIGDLFNLWIGDRALEQPHHRRVVERFREMRTRGIRIRYVEGNRDFHIGEAYSGVAFDDSTDGGIVESFGGKSIFAAHGDLANLEDRQYRAWRRVGRSTPFWWLFNAIPRARRFRLAEKLETRMRATNLDHKAVFPEDEVRRYSAGFLSAGHDAVVLGHFHEEHDLRAGPSSPSGRILVLPYWKDAHRFLRVTRQGEIRFEAQVAVR